MTKIDVTIIEEVEDLGTAGSLWFYSKNFNADIVNTNAFKSF